MKPILEQIPLGQQQTIFAFRHDKPVFTRPYHFHPQHELTYIESSVGTKFIGDYVGAYEPGELVLLRSNLPHCWKNHPQADVAARSVVVQWNKGIFAKVPELVALFTMLRTAARGIIFNKTAAVSVAPLMQQLPDLHGQELYFEFLGLLLRLANCSYETLSAAQFTDELPTEYSSRMAKIHDFIETHYARKIYLRELAGLVHLSEQSFSRFFSKMMGRSFFTFLNEYRINVASRMLIDTNWSVAEIGLRCGYESLPFFHKQFNKFKEVSPGHYRKRYRA